MADGILVACPSCKKQMKVPDTAAGKKIRCPGCKGAVPVPSKPGQAVDTRVTTPQIQKKMAAQREEDEIARDPYGVTHESMKPRCPFCAHELDSEDTRICLNCGYDMIKRNRVESKQVYERTTADFVIWHLPTLACFLAIVAMVGGFLYYHYYLPEVVMGKEHANKLANDRWGYFDDDQAQSAGFMFHWGIEVWLIVVGLFITWKCSRFIFKRLFLQFLPPERLKNQ